MDDARKTPMTVMREFQAMSIGLRDEVEKTMQAMRAGNLKSAPAAQPLPATSGVQVRSKAPSSLTGLKSPNKSQNGEAKPPRKVQK
jgi:hypothetical protein